MHTHSTQSNAYILAIYNQFSVAECDFSAVDIEGRTALHWTITNPNPSALNSLIQAYPPLLNER